MLLINLNPPKLCKGFRLHVKALRKNIIEIIVITVCARRDIVFIPRITSVSTNYPIKFKRIQFLLKVYFAITINKYQGQSLSMVVIE